MTVCRYFQQGTCRFGDDCRYEHYNPYKVVHPASSVQNYPAAATNNVTPEQLYNQVAADTNAAINSGQWVLSSYAPFKNKLNFPGLVDISPEEIRLQIYEARNNGTLYQVESQIAQLQSQTLEKLRALVKPNKAIRDVIESVYNNENLRDPFSDNQQGFHQNSNTFGNAVSVQPSNNIFGGGSQNSSSFASSLFADAAKTLSQNPAPTTNIFGGQPNSFGSNIFQTQMESTTNVFGGFNQQPNSVFNTQPETAQVPNQETLFSNNSQTFSNPTPAFNNNTPQTNSTIFGQAAPTVSPSSLFASANASLDTSVQTNIFSNANNTLPSVETNINPFTIPASNANPFQKSTNNNIFGIGNNGTSSFFGKPESATVSQNIYSKIEDLTEEELNAFKSDYFQAGKIPEIPPPLELCN